MQPRADLDLVIRLVNNSFLNEGDIFTKPTVVMFPFITRETTFDEGYGLAAALINESDKSRFDEIMTKLNDANDLPAARKALRSMPKHLFVSSLFRSTFAQGSDGTVNEYIHSGDFCENLRKEMTAEECSLDELQTAVKAATKKGQSYKKVVAKRQCFLVSAQGRKYPFYDFDLK